MQEPQTNEHTNSKNIFEYRTKHYKRKTRYLGLYPTTMYLYAIIYLSSAIGTINNMLMINASHVPVSATLFILGAISILMFVYTLWIGISIRSLSHTIYCANLVYIVCNAASLAFFVVLALPVVIVLIISAACAALFIALNFIYFIKRKDLFADDFKPFFPEPAVEKPNHKKIKPNPVVVAQPQIVVPQTENIPDNAPQIKDYAKLKKKYPWFDFESCMENAAFATAVDGGMPVKKAYKLFFKDEIAKHKKTHETSKFWTYKHTIIAAAIVVVCAAIVVPITLAQNDTINQLRSNLSDKQYELNRQISAFEYCCSISNKYKRFLDNCVVIVADDGTIKYHTYGCDKLDLSCGFSVYSPEEAKSKGYKACSCVQSSVRDRALIVSDHETIQFIS